MEILCECRPVLVSEAAQKKSTTLDGWVNPVHHLLWKCRFLAPPCMLRSISFYVNEVMGVATYKPPEPHRFRWLKSCWRWSNVFCWQWSCCRLICCCLCILGLSEYINMLRSNDCFESSSCEDHASIYFYNPDVNTLLLS